MNKVAIYILIVLIFLGASRIFTSYSKFDKYIFNELSYSELFEGHSISIILQDAYQTGFIIKSNVHRYRVVRVFGQSEIITIRVTKEYFQKTLNYLGLSLFRRDEEGMENTVPVPPGSLFIGNTAYGDWGFHISGVRRWVFREVYQFLKEELLWGEFQPDEDFYHELQLHLINGKEFFGVNNEFGPKGMVTQSQLSLNWYRRRNKKFKIQDYIAALVKFPVMEEN